MQAVVSGTGSYLPDRVVTSAELGPRIGVAPDWIFTKTAIRERRVAAAEESTSDLAAEAARRALLSARLSASDIDLIVLATSTPDQPMPATACVVQDKIGASNAAALDVDAVCTGFIYALVLARAMLLADDAMRRILVIGADTYSRVLDYTDCRTAPLFGDGAGAVVLEATDSSAGIVASTLGSDGTLAHLVQIPAGGSRQPASAESVASGGHFFSMRGGDVRRLANQVFPKVVGTLLDAASLNLDDIDMIAPHQANGRMLAAWADALGLGPDVMHVTVERYGNTGAASIPVTLDDAVHSGRLTPGALVLLVGFGGGMTWGGVAMRWNPAADLYPCM